jgi:hypothetical protein
VAQSARALGPIKPHIEEPSSADEVPRGKSHRGAAGSHIARCRDSRGGDAPRCYGLVLFEMQ